MPVIQCPIAECTYRTEDVEVAIAAALLVIHNNVHIAAPPNVQAAIRQRAPKIERPRISAGSSEETWNTFNTRWAMFKRGTELAGAECVQHLFHCCEEDLGDAILKGHPDAVGGSEDQLLVIIKQMAVIPVAICVRRAELLSTNQDHGENARAFYAKVKGKAATCSYSLQCSSGTCTQMNDFTDVMVKDVVITGLADEEVKRDVLGWSDLDDKSLEETVNFIEAKEMARDAMKKGPIAAGISSYKKAVAGESKASTKTLCNLCKTEIEKFVWSKRQKKTVECTLCYPCWRKNNPKRGKGSKGPNDNRPADETSALLVGGITAVTSISDCESSSISSRDNPHGGKEIILDHHIFNSQDGWKKSESLPHPTLRLQLTADASDYNHIGAMCPSVTPSYVTVVSDTGAQSCLWSLHDFYRCGFKDSDLLPVKRTMRAANMEEIEISGAVFVRLSGTDASGNTHTAPIMAYVSPSTQKFYLSREALVQLGVIPKNFPEIGAAMEASAIACQTAPCGCPMRSLPPERPDKLPFPVCPENNEKMKVWLGEVYKPSTWNKCPHQVLKGVTGPDLKLHLNPNAEPKAIHIPSKVPIHWEETVKQQLHDDVNLGVLEPVPHGQPSEWCHRMVVTRKPDGGPRRTVDMSALNKACRRETHYVKPPFNQAKSIPMNTWKTVTDAWNGFHSVPLAKEDRHLTAFLTPWGRYQYLMAPQGSLASGDGYSRRYDEVIADVERKTKCVDDTVQWDEDLEAHWWRTIDFLELCGRNGIVLNFEKFQFAQREINFAGFRITETEVKPLDKYIRAISGFPTPKNRNDIRSWFGLVRQVSHYNQLTDMMEPFKPFLSPKQKFLWNKELNEAFEASKIEIVNAIKDGVEIFDPAKLTCLRPDWSQKGIGYFLSQKHCDCDSAIPGCCEHGWRITLAGSRFLKPAETRYAAVEGEALAIAWSLEHTRYFTQGCDNLVIVTDHKPLVKLFGDRALDEITNSRLFSLKQRTLPWRFSVAHMSGKDNSFSDATSRNPVSSTNEEDVSSSEILAGVMIAESDDTDVDDIAATLSCQDIPGNFRAITWEVVKQETSSDELMRNLSIMINSAFPDEKHDLPAELLPYWNIRNNLYIVDGVVLMKDQVVIPASLRDSVTQALTDGSGTRIIIPPNLRQEIIQSLHSAHQGVGSMNERAKAAVYWPGITKDVESVRANCSSCNRIMPSQARTLPVEPVIPSTPFEAIACDYFHFSGHYYFTAADRLTGWLEVQQIKVGTNEAGGDGLCKALRRMMITFGVPVEISSDGGPEFTAGGTQAFFKRWGIRHRLSSVSFPSSNGRAELAVKTAKRLLMDNISPNGSLDNDGIVRALLVYRNTPDPGCKLSPAQILMGHPLRDTLPCISKDVMVFNNLEVHPQWKEAWAAKEEALKTRYVKSLENLSEHARPLPTLEYGDQVMIQNQSGRYPKKWDKSGVVVEIKANDQYAIKVDGSGRLTLRNRRFLRKYESHGAQNQEWGYAYSQKTASSDADEKSGHSNPTTTPSGTMAQHPHSGAQAQGVVEHDQTTYSQNSCTPSIQQGSTAHCTEDNELQTYPPDSPTSQQRSPARVSFETDVVAPPAVVLGETSRPRRERKQRQMYDPMTGKSSTPQPVPDDL